MKLRLVTSTIWIGILLNILILFKLNPIYCQINEVSNLVLNNVNIIDGISNSIQYGRTIVVKDSIIIGIGDEEDFEVSENAIVLDLEGKYVIPGLIEGHAHIQNLPDKQLENALRWGITSIRSMADDASYIQELNSAIQNEILLGPEIYYSSVLGGELLFEEDIRVQLATPENFSLGEAPWMRMIDDSSDIQAIIIEAKKNGVHGIKLYNYLNPGQIKTIVKYSKINDLMVWSHPHLTYSDAKEIALSNVDLITHAMGLLLPKDWNNKTHNSFELDSQSFCTGRIDSILNIVKKMIYF